MASGRRAAKLYGAKVGLIESNRLGGTCVNVGYVDIQIVSWDLFLTVKRCVPKKVMWYAASMQEAIHEAPSYGFNLEQKGEFDWPTFKQKRDAYIKRLNGIYSRNLNNDNVTYIPGRARFLSKNEVEVDEQTLEGEKLGTKVVYTANKILIATGKFGKFSGRNIC